METLGTLTGRIARRDPVHAEATLQADIRAFILAAGLNVADDQMADD